MTKIKMDKFCHCVHEVGNNMTNYNLQCCMTGAVYRLLLCCLMEGFI